MGGDITGKAMVPIIRRQDQRDTIMFDQHVVLKADAEVADIERKIRNRGYYPVRMSGDDCDQLQADPEEVTRWFTQVILRETQRWIEMADDKLRGKVHLVIVCYITKAGERYGSAGPWHSTRGAATKRACCRARSSHSTRKKPS